MNRILIGSFIVFWLLSGCGKSESVAAGSAGKVANGATVAESTAEAAAGQEPVRMDVQYCGGSSGPELFRLYCGEKPLISYLSRHSVGFMKLLQTQTDGTFRATYESISSQSNYQDFLLDLKGNGERRYLIFVDWAGGNDVCNYKGWLIDAWDDFAIIGEVPAGEAVDYPQTNPDLIFDFSDEIGSFGVNGYATITVSLKIAKGHFPECVPLRHGVVQLNAERYRAMPHDMAVYSVYCDCASLGRIRLANSILKKVGIPQTEIAQYAPPCLEKIRSSRFYPYLVQLNNGGF